MNTVPNPDPLPQSATAPKNLKGNFLIVLILVAFIVLAVAVIAEVYYLSTHAETRCKLLGCKEVEIIAANIDAPKSLNPERIDEIRSILDRLSPEKKEANFFNQAQFTLTGEGIVRTAGPDIFVSPEGKTYAYQITVVAENQDWFRYRFTQEELALMEVSVVTYDGKSFPATVNDIKEGDDLILRIVNDFLDTRTGDSINLEILREKF